MEQLKGNLDRRFCLHPMPINSFQGRNHADLGGSCFRNFRRPLLLRILPRHCWGDSSHQPEWNTVPVSFKREQRTHCGLRASAKLSLPEGGRMLYQRYSSVQPRAGCCSGQLYLIHKLSKEPCSPYLWVPLRRKGIQWYLPLHRTYPPQSGGCHTVIAQ